MEQKAMRVISPLSEDVNGYVAYVKTLLERKLKTNKSPDSTYQGANVYHLGDKQNGYVVLEQSGEILYFVRHELIKHNKLQVGRQVLVWRNKEAYKSGASAGFASKVFFDYLLPKYKALIADKEQTRDGKQFWEYAIRSAFQRNDFVYFLNRRSTPNSLTRLISYQEVLDRTDELWGIEEGHLRTFAVISELPLKIKT